MKKIPMRRCVVTNESWPKRDLLRIVRNKEGEVSIDLKGKAPGKGAYIKKDPAVLEMAIKRKSLERALDAKIDEELYAKIKEVISEKQPA